MPGQFLCFILLTTAGKVKHLLRDQRRTGRARQRSFPGQEKNDLRRGRRRRSANHAILFSPRSGGKNVVILRRDVIAQIVVRIRRRINTDLAVMKQRQAVTGSRQRHGALVLCKICDTLTAGSDRLRQSEAFIPQCGLLISLFHYTSSVTLQ